MKFFQLSILLLLCICNAFQTNSEEESNLPTEPLSIQSITPRNGIPFDSIQIGYCPIQASISKTATLRIAIANGLFNTAFCSNCPAEAAFLDRQNGMRFEFMINPMEDIIFENGQVFFEVNIPNDIPPNAVYDLVFTTQNGYTYTPSNSCTTLQYLLPPRNIDP